jgi:hypothetical protein
MVRSALRRFAFLLLLILSVASLTGSVIVPAQVSAGTASSGNPCPNGDPDKPIPGPTTQYRTSSEEGTIAPEGDLVPGRARGWSRILAQQFISQLFGRPGFIR